MMGKYALTEHERKWLEERKKRTQHCDTCPNRVGYYELCSSCRSRSLYGLSLCPDYRDAAEFESKAKVILARYNADDSCVPGGLMYCDSPDLTCFDCRIANANILAEQEMRGLCPKN